MIEDGDLVKRLLLTAETNELRYCFSSADSVVTIAVAIELDSSVIFTGAMLLTCSPCDANYY